MQSSVAVLEFLFCVCVACLHPTDCVWSGSVSTAQGHLSDVNSCLVPSITGNHTNHSNLTRIIQTSLMTACTNVECDNRADLKRLLTAKSVMLVTLACMF